MKRLMLAVVLSATFEAGAVEPKSGFALGGDAARGQVVYAQFCGSCHGEGGVGDGAAAAAINPKPANFTDVKHAAQVSDEYIYKMIKEGGAANGKSPFMVAWGPVLGDDAKVRDVAAYVRSLSKPKPTTKPAKK